MEYETDGFGVIYNKVLSSHYMLSSWLRGSVQTGEQNRQATPAETALRGFLDSSKILL